MRLLIVEDNKDMTDVISEHAGRLGLSCDAAPSIDDARLCLVSAIYDAIILDLGLPDGDGGDLVKEMRSRGDATPILVVSARNATEERVAMLDRGADDYLGKPFDVRELEARMRSLLRRPPHYLGHTLEFGDLLVDVATRQASVGGKPVVIKPKEFKLLEHLLRRAGRVVRKNFLEENMYGVANEISSNSLEVGMHRLRRLLERAESTVSIRTVRGVGYILCEQP